MPALVGDGEGGGVGDEPPDEGGWVEDEPPDEGGWVEDEPPDEGGWVEDEPPDEGGWVEDEPPDERGWVEDEAPEDGPLLAKIGALSLQAVNAKQPTNARADNACNFTDHTPDDELRGRIPNVL